MFNVRVKFQAGGSDTSRYATEDEAWEAVRAAYGRMRAGREGISDVLCWRDF